MWALFVGTDSEVLGSVKRLLEDTDPDLRVVPVQYLEEALRLLSSEPFDCVARTSVAVEKAAEEAERTRIPICAVEEPPLMLLRAREEKSYRRGHGDNPSECNEALDDLLPGKMYCSNLRAYALH